MSNMNRSSSSGRATGGTFRVPNSILMLYMLCFICLSEVWRSLRATESDRQLRAQSISISSKTYQLNSPKEKPTTMSACLLVMDDPIKLSEWIAYHYTVLPLGDLIVAIDPNSRKSMEMETILETWRDPKLGLNVTIWKDDKWMEVGPSEGWPITQPILPSPPPKTHPTYDFLAHIRRQNLFSYSCMRELKRRDREWTLHVDSDEFLLFNTIHPEREDWESYDKPYDRWRTHEDVDKARIENRPIRENLPPLGSETLLSVLDKMNDRSCFHIATIPVSSQEATHEKRSQNVPSIIQPEHMMTLRHRHHASSPTTQSTRMLINLADIPLEDIQLQFIRSRHNLHSKICGSMTDAENDFLASPFRINHYIGTKESWMDRQISSRDHRNDVFWKSRNNALKDTKDDDDIRPWVSAFVDKVGEKGAKDLLHYLEEAYE